MSDDMKEEGTEPQVQKKESPLSEKANVGITTPNRGPDRPRKAYIGSPEQLDSLRDKIKFHREVAKNATISVGEGKLDGKTVEGQGGSGSFYTPPINPRSHAIEADKLQRDLDRVTPVQLTESEKDVDYRLALCIREQFRELAPNVDEMMHATSYSVRKNRWWLYRNHDFNGNVMTGDRAQLLYQKIMRSIDPDESCLEDFRKGR